MKFIYTSVAAMALALTAQAAHAQDSSAFDGPYVGVQVSAGQVQNKHSDLDDWYENLIDARNEDAGALVGGKAGYDHVSGSLLVGVFAEAQFGKLDSVADITPFDPRYAIGTQSDMIGSVRGKIGLVSGNLAVSVNGGYAISDADHLMGDTDGSTEGYTAKADRSGFVLGAGMQYAVSSNVNIGLDVSHYQFGKTNHEVLDAGVGQGYFFDQSDRFETVSISINYSF